MQLKIIALEEQPPDVDIQMHQGQHCLCSNPLMGFEVTSWISIHTLCEYKYIDGPKARVIITFLVLFL